MATTFAVTIERHGRFWEIEIPDIEGGYTQARNLAEADLMARDCIAAFKGIAADSFEIDLTVKLPDSVQKHLSDAQALAEQAATAQAQAQAAHTNHEPRHANSKLPVLPSEKSAPCSASRTSVHINLSPDNGSNHRVRDRRGETVPGQVPET